MLAKPIGRRLLPANLLEDLSQPGVYIVRDGEGAVQYVGSSARLGDRVFSKSHHCIGVNAGKDGMTIEIEIFEDVEAAKDREDELIARLQPPKNTAGIPPWRIDERTELAALASRRKSR
jgi:excinuclease UvrABC nuclease subunit